MARAAWIVFLLTISAAPTATLAARVLVKEILKVATERSDENSALSNITQAPPLCDSAIVKEVCSAMIPNGDIVKQEYLVERLSATAESVARAWRALDLADEPSCSDVCQAVVDYVDKAGVLPPASDVACYTLDGKVHCDEYVGPEVLSFGPTAPEDLPESLLEDPSENPESDMSVTEEDSDNMGEGDLGKTGSLIPDTDEEGLDFPTWELVKHTAMLFRIFPEDKPDDASSLAEVRRGYKWPPGGEALTMQAQVDAKAYLIHTIAAFNKKATKEQMTRWFGSSAFSSTEIRTKVLKSLNSVLNMISNVHFVPRGKECSPKTYAYVYPQANICPESQVRRDPCTKTGDKFVFYLCPFYFKTPGEMVNTLVHEGSHHASAYLDDVQFQGATAYGRKTCRDLAILRPLGAIKNADNFCYYVQDTADQVRATGGSDPKVPVSTIPAIPKTPDTDTIETAGGEDAWDADEVGEPTCMRSGPTGHYVKSIKPDEAGNCHCKFGSLTCYDGNAKGCKTAVRSQGKTMYFSKHNRYHASCFTCSCKY